MVVICKSCDSLRWIGLVYCTRCGVLATETAQPLPLPTQLAPVYDGPVDIRPGRTMRVFPVCGDLIVAHSESKSSLLTISSTAEGPHLGQRLMPEDFPATGAEAVTAGRWVVVRSPERLLAMPAPLLRVTDADRRFAVLGEGESVRVPKRSARAIAAFGAAGASSIARLGSYLVALWGAPPSKTVLRVFDLGIARQSEIEAVELFKTELDGEWLLDRGGWTGSDRLVLHSPDRVAFLELLGSEVQLTQSHHPSPHQIWPATTVLTDHELLYLGVAGDNESTPYSWEYRRDPRSAPKAVGGVGGHSIAGIEPWSKNGRRSAVARVERNFYPYTREELSFSTAAIPHLQISNTPPSTPGAVVYEAESLDHLRVRFSDEDLAIPMGVRLESRVDAVEGNRLWLLGAHRDTSEPWLRVYDRRPA